jgi:hypothetical protein
MKDMKLSSNEFLSFSFYDSLFLSHLKEEKGREKEMPMDFVVFVRSFSHDDDST